MNLTYANGSPVVDDCHPLRTGIGFSPDKAPRCRLFSQGEAPNGQREDRMRVVFTRTGGLCSSEELVDLLRDRFDQPMSMLARWIVGRSVVSMQVHSRVLLPLFQFDLRAMALRPEASAVVSELVGVFDDQEVSRWFAEPNGWLQDQRPVELLRSAPSEVLMAARADRYVARG
jgi:hypothetical protein